MWGLDRGQRFKNLLLVPIKVYTTGSHSVTQKAIGLKAMVSLKRRNQMTGLERRVRPRIEKESEFDDGEASSDAAQSSNESEDDNSSEVLRSDEESDNVSKSSL